MRGEYYLDELQHHSELAWLLDLLDLVQEVHLLLGHELLHLLDLLPDPVIHGGAELEVAQLVQDLANEKRVLGVLTNERRVLPDHTSDHVAAILR